MSKRPLSLEEFNDVYSRVPRLTVEVIARPAGGILLTQRLIEPCKGLWHIPGGTVHMGESPEDTVRRVADEELGLLVEPRQLLGRLTYPKMVAAGYKGWPVGLAYEAEIVSGELRGSFQGEKIRVFTKIPSKMVPDQADFLRQYQLLK